MSRIERRRHRHRPLRAGRRRAPSHARLRAAGEGRLTIEIRTAGPGERLDDGSGRSGTTSASPAGPDEERGAGNAPLPEGRVHVATDGGAIVGRRGRVSVRAHDSGWARPDRGRDGRRRAADPPAPWDRAGADERPAQGRACARRADRRALGLGGWDLRPVRLRDGLASAPTSRSPGARGVQRGRSTGRERRLVTATRPWSSSRRSTTVSPATTPGMISRGPRSGGRRARWPTPSGSAPAGGELAFAVLERPERPEAYAIYRLNFSYADGRSDRDDRRDRGDGRRLRRPRPRCGATSSTSTGWPRSRPSCCPSTTRSICFSSSRAG